jgi:hypothetical protein
MQEDDIFKIKDNCIYFLANDRKENWKDMAVKWKDQDVHIMNKQAILRKWDNLMEMYA